MKILKNKFDVFAVVVMTTLGFVVGLVAGVSANNDNFNTTTAVIETTTVVQEQTTEKTTVQETTTEVPLTTVKAEDVPKLKDLGTFQYFWYCREEYPHICNDGAPYLTKMETEMTDKTVAVEPNVIPLGSTLYIGGEYYTAEDTGGNIKGNRIDFNCATHSQALQNGKGYVKVFLVVE